MANQAKNRSALLAPLVARADRDEERSPPHSPAVPSRNDMQGNGTMTTTPNHAAQVISPGEHSARMLITVDELASILGLSIRTIWRMLSKGNMLTPVRIGKNVRWRLYEVQMWIENGCPRPEGRRN